MAEPSLVDQLAKMVVNSLQTMHQQKVQMPRYAEEKFWDERYNAGDAPQWYVGIETLYPYLMSVGIEESSKILVVGCGTSLFSEDLYNFGFQNITNVDFSEVAIDEMKVKCRALTKMRWLYMDVRDMRPLESNSFDLVIDIGTFDAIMCGSEESGRLALCEMMRVLKVDGSIVIVSHSSHTARLSVFSPSIASTTSSSDSRGAVEKPKSTSATEHMCSSSDSRGAVRTGSSSLTSAGSPHSSSTQATANSSRGVRSANQSAVEASKSTSATERVSSSSDSRGAVETPKSTSATEHLSSSSDSRGAVETPSSSTSSTTRASSPSALSRANNINISDSNSSASPRAPVGTVAASMRSVDFGHESMSLLRQTTFQSELVTSDADSTSQFLISATKPDLNQSVGS